MRVVVALTLFLLIGAALPATAEETVSVVVKKTSIRKEPKFFSPSLGEAQYRDKLNVVERADSWMKVGHKGVNGWIHLTAVTSKNVTPGKKGLSLWGKDSDPTEVSEEEISIAGKGFNEKVEGEYRSNNPGISFSQVDEMEKIAVPTAELGAFLKAGNLVEREDPK